MEEKRNLQTIQRALHEINFGEHGLVQPLGAQTDAKAYCFKKLNEPDPRRDEKGKWKKRCHTYPDTPCYCTRCNAVEPLVNEGSADKQYQFTSITHGTHTLDFLDAHEGVDIGNWSTKPVLFLFENPGAANSGNFGKDGYHKPSELPPRGERLPCKWWYWINGQDECTSDDFLYPNWFVQKEYGWMVCSAIHTFKMANAYVTNMVKCGIGSTLKEYVTIESYNTQIVDNCFEHLKAEVSALRGTCDEEVTVFAFGKHVYGMLKDREEALAPCKIHLLPHPANRLANDYRKYVLLGKIMGGLLQADFYEGGVARPDLEALLSK